MTDPLVFISQSVIERLEAGAFVPSRAASRQNRQAGERRDALSPLAVTKRCIRYEPNVFLHRKPIILQLAHALNHSEEPKILLVGGPQGIGKTSLVRGVIELMGGAHKNAAHSQQEAQLLWFDVNRHTDFEEIIQFLIQYITYVCSSAGEMERRADRSRDDGLPASRKDDPLQKLEALIRQVSDMPLLLVLDNVEYIVDPELRFNSYPFKEMLNFLLAFPNIKMVLIGERLPYADMSPNQSGVMDIKLSGLPEADAQQFLQSRKKEANALEPDPGVLERVAAPQAELAALYPLYLKTHGAPWLLKTLLALHHQAQLDFYTLNRFLEPSEPSGGRRDDIKILSGLLKLIFERLPEPQRRLLQTMCFLRHPLNAQGLLAAMSACYPVLGPAGLTPDALETLLEHPLLKPLLKICYPPQDVLTHIRNRKQVTAEGQAEAQQLRKYKPWYELYHVAKRALYHSLSAEERERVHAALQDFYLREKSHEAEKRILRIKNRALLAEAKHHGSQSRGDATRERKREEPGIASKAYLYSQAQPLSPSSPSAQRWTLDDYRGIQLPEETASAASPGKVLSDEAETSLDGPTFLELAKEPGSFQDVLSGIELSDEEKYLLGGSKSFTPIMRNSAEPAFPIEFSEPSSVVERVEMERMELSAPDLQPNSIPDLQHLTDGLLDEDPLNGSTSREHVNSDEAEKRIQQRLANAVASRDKPLIARELLNLARYRAGHGRYEGAGQCLEKALSLQAETGKDVLAEIYRLSGSVHKETYHHNAAIGALSKAIVYIKRLMFEDDTVDAVWMGRMGQVYQDLGEIQAYRKQYAEAVENLTQALRWYHSADDALRQAEVYFQLADVYEALNEPDNAIVHYEKALALDEANGNLMSAASALSNMGSLHLDADRLEEALNCFQRSLSYDREIQNREGQLNTLEYIANIHLLREAWEPAAQTCKQALSLAIQDGLGLWQASFYMKLGQLDALQKHWTGALKHYELARSLGEKTLSQESLGWIDQKITEAQAALR